MSFEERAYAGLLLAEKSGREENSRNNKIGTNLKSRLTQMDEKQTYMDQSKTQGRGTEIILRRQRRKEEKKERITYENIVKENKGVLKAGSSAFCGGMLAPAGPVFL